jgi:hypothetical protein
MYSNSNLRICRAYLSQRSYGGKSYRGSELVHSLITLGSPHGNAPGPAFKGVEWVNRERLDGVRVLGVGGTGYKGECCGTLDALDVYLLGFMDLTRIVHMTR